MTFIKAGKLVAAAAILSVVVVGCTVDADETTAPDTDTPITLTADTPTDELGLEGTIDIETAGDVALMSIDADEFYDSVDTLGYELALLGWEAGFNGAAEPFGFTDKEIFDEILSRR